MRKNPAIDVVGIEKLEEELQKQYLAGSLSGEGERILLIKFHKKMDVDSKIAVKSLGGTIRADLSRLCRLGISLPENKIVALAGFLCIQEINEDLQGTLA